MTFRSALLSIVLVSPTFAQSVIQFSAALGGNNHRAAWKAGTPQLYTPGSPLDVGQPGHLAAYNPGDIITWDVSVAVSGVQQVGAGAGSAVQGAANLVFDLEVRSGTAGGPLVPQADFFSSINDGTGSDSTRSAAFAASMNLFGLGPGRMIDRLTSGASYMSVYTYPTNENNGRLLGMGAGYLGWQRTGPVSGITTAGVGMDLLPNGSTPGFGVLPLFEGQIDTTSMLPGLYVLRVNPADGNNVLRGDIDLVTQNQAAYAVAADQTIGDTLTFQILPEPGSLVLFAMGSVFLFRRRP